MRLCKVCNQPIPEGRLKALPETQTCTEHSSANKVQGHAMITGKTEYSALQIVTAEQAEELQRLGDRKGMGVSSGVKFDSDLQGTSNGH